MLIEIKGRDITKKNITSLLLAFFALFCSLIFISASDKLSKQAVSSANVLRLAEETILDDSSKLSSKNSPMLNEDILPLIQNRHEYLFDNLSIPFVYRVDTAVVFVRSFFIELWIL